MTGFPICANVTSVAGLPTLTRAGITLFRLPAAVIPAGVDAEAWYQGLCAGFGLRPVACDENFKGTANRAYNGASLPMDPFHCNLDPYITAQFEPLCR